MSCGRGSRASVLPCSRGAVQDIPQVLDGFRRSGSLRMPGLWPDGKNTTGVARTLDTVFCLAATQGGDALQFDHRIEFILPAEGAFLEYRAGLFKSGRCFCE